MSFDASILGNVERKISLLAFDNTACEGVYKLVQKTLILLFSDSSSPYNRGYATTLAQDLKGGIADMEIVRNFFNIALSQVKRALQQSTALDAPDDEKLQSYQLQMTPGSRGDMVATITVTSQAGTSASVKVPVEKLAAQEQPNAEA
jgi:hypothetical protein